MSGDGGVQTSTSSPSPASLIDTRSDKHSDGDDARSPSAHRQPTQHPYSGPAIGTIPQYLSETAYNASATAGTRTASSISPDRDGPNHLVGHIAPSPRFPPYGSTQPQFHRPAVSPSRTLAILERRLSTDTRSSIRPREGGRRHGGRGSSLGSLSLPPVVNASSDSRQDAGPLPPISSIVASTTSPAPPPPHLNQGQSSSSHTMSIPTSSSSRQLLPDIDLDDAEFEVDIQDDVNGWRRGGVVGQAAGDFDPTRHRDWDHPPSHRSPSTSFPTLPSPIPPHESYSTSRPSTGHSTMSNRYPFPPPRPSTRSSRSRSPAASSRRQHQPNNTNASSGFSRSPSGSLLSQSSSTSVAVGSSTQTVGGSLARPHVCPLCPLAFTRAHDLKRHTMTHTGEKRFKCLRCGKAYGRKDALKRHACAMSTGAGGGAGGSGGGGPTDTGAYGAFMAGGGGSGHTSGGWIGRGGALESPEVVGEGEAGPSTGANLRRTATWTSSRSSSKRGYNEEADEVEDGDEDAGSRRMASPRTRTRSQHPIHNSTVASASSHPQRIIQGGYGQLSAPPIVGAAAAALVHMQSNNLSQSSAGSSSASLETRPDSRHGRTALPYTNHRPPAFHPPMRPPSASPTTPSLSPSPPLPPMQRRHSPQYSHPHPPMARPFATSGRGGVGNRPPSREQFQRRISDMTERQGSPPPNGASASSDTQRPAHRYAEDSDDDDSDYSS
ncbi:hypothetical protein FRB95_002421 [Tulasnella sp. JGI-2019a]|nr:hypothetical protein FRB95_002421 [Tulasnella sp. JGI-2019a]